MSGANKIFLERVVRLHAGSEKSLFLRLRTLIIFWRNGRVVECGGLENRCPPTGGPGVRIPLSPLFYSIKTL
jgi:hypothetical protein